MNVHHSYANHVTENMGRSKKGFRCNICNKSYTRKFNLQRHKASIHSDETEKFKKKRCNICRRYFTTNYSLQRHKARIHSEETHSNNHGSQTEQQPEQQKMAEFKENICETVYLSPYVRDIYILQKGDRSIRLHKQELLHILNMTPEIHECICDYIKGKTVQFQQNLGEDIYLSICTPYKCVNIRKFWTIPGTDQLLPTKIGIPLSFIEYYQLLKVLEKRV